MALHLPHEKYNNKRALYIMVPRCGKFTVYVCKILCIKSLIVDQRNLDFNQYLNTVLDREAFRSYQQQVAEQVLLEKSAILQEEFVGRQRLLIIIVVGFVFIIFVILAMVVILVIFLRQTKPCQTNLKSQAIGNFQCIVHLFFCTARNQIFNSRAYRDFFLPASF
jgi:hypothetical protein